MSTGGPASRIARTWSATTIGIEAVPVEVEVHVRSGLPSYAVVGLPHATVRESRDRVLSALRASDLPVPRGAITVNLAPADVRKDGALFDLPLAVALLAADGSLPLDGRAGSAMVVGELALDGRVRPVRGAVAVVLAARSLGLESVILPFENADEAAAVGGAEICPVADLGEVVSLLRGFGRPWRPGPRVERVYPPEHDLADVRGQAGARRALEIAAAGRHGVLLVGPPGSGKSMLARRLPGLLPALSDGESLDVTRTHSVAGLLTPGVGLLRRGPFRAPHHSVTPAGMLGGGAPPRPGEIALADRGVLFLDELPEFRRSVLEALRQPLEEGCLVVSRARWRVTFPARFILVASMNPCPCGHGAPASCTCTPEAVRRYRGRVSGPIRDRIDLHVAVDPVPASDWFGAPGESTGAVAERVRMARERQKVRRGRGEGLPDDGRRLLADAMDRLGLSGRAAAGVARVARTIADLDGDDRVRVRHVAEAIQYRLMDRPSLQAD